MEHIYNLSGEELYNQALDFLKTKDYDNYAIYITMAANYQNADAIKTIYNNDYYRNQNYSRTFKFYEQSANNLSQNSYSLHYLAYMYENGLWIKKDIAKAFNLYQLAIEKNNVHSICKIAFLYIADGKYSQAIELYQSQIKQNNTDAMNGLAEMYVHGFGIKQDFSKAKKLLKASYKLGNLISLVKLAKIYANGYGVEINYAKAIKLYEKSVENESGTACNNLAKIYDAGQAVKQNINKAIELYKLGIELGSVTCHVNLAILYLKNNIVDYEQIVYILQQGYEKGSLYAFLKLVSVYKKPYFKNKQADIFDYFYNIGQLEKLKDIYNFNDYVITVIKTKYELEAQNIKLKVENLDLKTHIESSPDGKLYFEAKREWEKNLIDKL